jgi:xanthine dehydrogenase molybdopterin binding subunit
MSKKALYHDSAIGHVSGSAIFVADMPGPGETLSGYVVYSKHAHARIESYNLGHARASKGVAAVLDHHSIPGLNQLNPLDPNEPCLAKGFVNCIGQAVFLIAAADMKSAVEAAGKIEIQYTPLPAILSIAEARQAGNQLEPTRVLKMGNPEQALQEAEFVLEGYLNTGGQEHWYLETQSAFCIPGEDGEMTVHASSQNPSETQMVVAELLGIPANKVICEVKRMGGGFGGKETQASHVAAWAALLAHATGKPVKMVLARDDDQIITGKRHRFENTYKIGFDQDGLISAYTVAMDADAGMARDLSMAILERALFHAENAYFIPNIQISGTMWQTNLPSNTAFRGFGGPQGMAVIENAIDRIARFLGKDAAEIRYRNLYGLTDRNVTPYGQLITQNHLWAINNKLMETAEYNARRIQADAFNARHTYKKRGLALTPVKFGISFTTSFLNQAGALVVVYTDGSVQVNHGGTEMGQGLNTKILGIACREFGLSPAKIRCTPTNTSKVPNTSPTAASTGSDLNGMAVKLAIEKLKKRLEPLAVKMITEKYGHSPREILYCDDHIADAEVPAHSIPFDLLTDAARKEQISLAATGYYGTPGLHFDRKSGKGRPFHYYAYGMAVSEAEVDVLTGAVRLIRTDILHDTGNSLHPEIDKGQVTGGFIQGVGWCTTEVLRYGPKGNLLNHSPDTYKIPGIGDIPGIFNVELMANVPNPEVIHSSKAVGEPPFMLAFSVWLAIKDAISAVGNHRTEPDFELPATNEAILFSIEKVKAGRQAEASFPPSAP